MKEGAKVIPEEFVEDIQLAIEHYMKSIESGIEKIETEIEFQEHPEVIEEVKSFMKTLGYPNMVRLEELKEQRERLQTIQKILTT